MLIILMLIMISLTVGLGFLAAFSWATYSGQFDDTSTPPYRMLFDSETSTSHDSKIEVLHTPTQHDAVEHDVHAKSSMEGRESIKRL